MGEHGEGFMSRLERYGSTVLLKKKQEDDCVLQGGGSWSVGGGRVEEGVVRA
jgi:hypothetical protein